MTTLSSAKGEEITQNIIAFKEWLGNLGISHVISFDDEWSILQNKTTHENRIDDYLNDDIDDFISNFALNVTEDEFFEIDNQGLTNVEDILQLDEGNNLDNVKQIFLEVFAGQKIIKPLEILKDVMEKVCEGTDIQFQMFSQLSFEGIEQISGRILFLLDMNMKKIGLSKDVVIDTITTLKSRRKGLFDLAIVYSHDDLHRYKQQQTKIEYIEEYLEKDPDILKDDSDMSRLEFKHLFAYQLWGINKTEEQKMLAEELLTTIEKAALGYSLHDYLESKMLLTNRATIELLNLPEKKMELLLQDSFVEGEKFLDILNRTHKSILNKIELEDIKEESNYKNIIKNIMKVASAKDKILLKKLNGQNIANFSKKELESKITDKTYSGIAEYNLIDYSINHLYENLYTGDLFELTLNGESYIKYAVLISANCDLPLRFPRVTSDGIARNESSLVLCLYEKDEIENKIKDIKNLKANENFLWPIKNGDYDDCILTPLNQFITLEGKLLDLCTLNSEGIAALELSGIDFSKTYKNYHTIKYIDETLKIWVEEVLTLDSYMDSSIYKGQVEKSKLLPVLAGLKYGIKMNTDNLSFAIKRIGRLNKETTLKVVQHNMSNLSRIGLEKMPFR
ncbi:hypothetical protein [Oceanobacillus sp. CFH 90083]|uniref:hypothetical protein n=1 Tax=Oceanobacillus sp. CFH 90083 TaxID=2592336 RepID=UPI00128AF66C|nr:hypothetical protein [Oceanobacillus sp. CFH 90083]